MLSIDVELFPVAGTGGKQVALVMSAEDFEKLLRYLQLDPNARLNIVTNDQATAEIAE